MMNRKSSSSNEAMDFMEFSKDATKLLRDVQCLQVKAREILGCEGTELGHWVAVPWGCPQCPHLVTLKIRRRRTHRNTEMPSGDMISSSTKMVSVMPPHTTKQSKRLKRDTK